MKMKLPQNPSYPLAALCWSFALTAAVLSLLAAIVYAQPLPPHEQHHPRLFFDASSTADLMAAINADPRRAQVWEDGQDGATNVADLAIFAGYFNASQCG